jgi:hypothetical protein
MTDFLAWVGKLWPLLATVGLVGTVVWFAAGIEGRISKLETQVHTLTVAPALAANGSSVPNPVAAACAELALKVLSAGRSDAERIRDTLQVLGCAGN